MDHTPATASPGPDAVDLLVADHGKVEKLFDEFSALEAIGAPPQAKEAVVREICSELKTHERLENEIFFPAVRDVLHKDDVLEDAAVEQKDASEVIAELSELDVADAGYDAQVLALGADISAHAEDEEIEVFPLVRESPIDTRELGSRMSARKQELQGELSCAEVVSARD